MQRVDDLILEASSVCFVKRSHGWTSESAQTAGHSTAHALFKTACLCSSRSSHVISLQWLDELVGTDRFLPAIEEQRAAVHAAERRREEAREGGGKLRRKREGLRNQVEAWRR